MGQQINAPSPHTEAVESLPLKRKLVSSLVGKQKPTDLINVGV